MTESLHFPGTAAAGYDDHVGQYTAKLVPRLLEIAQLKLGQRVLDVATGTGIAAAAAAERVGETGTVVATDISPHMLIRAGERVAGFSTASLSVEDGQALSFPDQSFDTVICNMGLMYFPEPEKGVSEFYRVLRPDGRATVSVFSRSGAVYRLSSGREFKAVSAMIAARKARSVHGGHFLKLGERVANIFLITHKAQPISGAGMAWGWFGRRPT